MAEVPIFFTQASNCQEKQSRLSTDSRTTEDNWMKSGLMWVSFSVLFVRNISWTWQMFLGGFVWKYFKKIPKRTWLVSGRSCSNPFWIPVTALLYAHVHKDGNDTCAWPGWHVLIPLVSFLNLNPSSWEQSSLHLNSTLAPLFLSVCVLQLSRTDLGFAHCSGVFTSFEFGADPEFKLQLGQKEKRRNEGAL